MRRSLFLYLFVFTALIAVFLYANSRRMLEAKNAEIEELKAEMAGQESGTVSNEPVVSSELFLFQANDAAMTYFEEQGFEAAAIAQRIKDEIISRNKVSEDNALVPYEGMDGNMRINSIRVLNHKWILADFTDGSHWGELFITYYLDENNQLVLETENSLLYTIN